MTKVDVINKVKSATGMSRKQAEAIVTATVDALAELIASGDEVHIPKLGTFYVKTVQERAARNPQTGESVMVPPHKRVGFKCSTTLKHAVNQ